MSKILTVACLAIACVGAAGCKVQQTQDAKMPEVTATGGQLPEYDVKGPDVSVTTEPRTVEVPKVKVTPAQ
jgi:hypothetical protein